MQTLSAPLFLALLYSFRQTLLLGRLADGIRLVVSLGPLRYWPELYKISGSATALHYRRPRVRRMADGKAPTAATGTAKTLFAVCQMLGTRQTYSPCVYIGTRRKKVSRRRHGQLTASAALRRVPAPWTHGKPTGFAVCPSGRHTAKDGHFAVCCVLAHDKVCFQADPYGYFAVCHGHGTRQSDRRNPVFFVF